MHSWIFRHILQLEAIYGRRARRRQSLFQVPKGGDYLPIHVLIPHPRVKTPGEAA